MISNEVIYHMMAYEFNVLRQEGFENLIGSSFVGMEFIVKVLLKAVQKQTRIGLSKSYIVRNEELSGVKGQICISKSISSFSLLRHRLVCRYNELTVDSHTNRIIKFTLLQLLASVAVSDKLKKEILFLLLQFDDVSDISYREINCSRDFNGGDVYKLILGLCKILLDMLYGKTDIKDIKFFDDMYIGRLYRRFVRRVIYDSFSGTVEVKLDEGNDFCSLVLRKDRNISMEILIKYYCSGVETEIKEDFRKFQANTDLCNMKLFCIGIESKRNAVKFISGIHSNIGVGLKALYLDSPWALLRVDIIGVLNNISKKFGLRRVNLQF